MAVGMGMDAISIFLLHRPLSAPLPPLFLQIAKGTSFSIIHFFLLALQSLRPTQLNSTQLPPPNLIIFRYFAELLAERQKLVPFVQILPQCTKLLTQGMRHSSLSFPCLLIFHHLLLFLILCLCMHTFCLIDVYVYSYSFILIVLFCVTEIRRMSGFNQGFIDHERLEPDSPFRPLGQHPNTRPMELEGWPALPIEVTQTSICFFFCYIYIFFNHDDLHCVYLPYSELIWCLMCLRTTFLDLLTLYFVIVSLYFKGLFYT